MGVTTAGFTLAAGIMSLIGGLMMAIDIRMPFYEVTAAAIPALIFIRTTWNDDDIKRISQ